MSGAKVASAVAGAGGAALGLLPWPQVDFAKFGPIETRPLSRIKKIAGANLHRNWVLIPHVTNHDDADITELEAFRVQLNKENEKAGIKVTLLAFLIKACVWALKKFPEFNASPRRREPGAQAVLPHRFRRRHAERSCRAGHQERRPERRAGDRRRNGGALGEGARRQARSGRHAGRMFFDLQPGRDRRNVLHAPVINAPESRSCVRRVMTFGDSTPEAAASGCAKRSGIGQDDGAVSPCRQLILRLIVNDMRHDAEIYLMRHRAAAFRLPPARAGVILCSAVRPGTTVLPMQWKSRLSTADQGWQQPGKRPNSFSRY